MHPLPIHARLDRLVVSSAVAILAIVGLVSVRRVRLSDWSF